MRISIWTIGLTTLILSVIALFIWVGSMLTVFATTESKCLAAGYAETSVSYKFERYCVRRDYMDVMRSIPMDEALKESNK